MKTPSSICDRKHLSPTRRALSSCEYCILLNMSDCFCFFRQQMSALMLYPEIAQQEEEDTDVLDDITGSAGDQQRRTSSDKKSMTQIPLTILPCCSAVSLCGCPLTAFYSNSPLDLTFVLQRPCVVFASVALRLVSGIFACLSAIRQPPPPQRGFIRRRTHFPQLLLYIVSSALRERSRFHVGSKPASKWHTGR